MFAAALCVAPLLFAADAFLPGVEVMRFPGSLTEISGLEQSTSSADVFWVHNDSGDEPRVYAVNRKGALVGTYTLAGAKAVDWEDMAIGPAPGGAGYLYMADIGDNNAKRDSVQIYRVPEPKVDPAQAPVTETLRDVAVYGFVYEDGPRDAESFFVDPLTGDFYVVTKRELDGNRLYRAVAPSANAVNKLVRVGTFGFTGATAADISSDGLQVIVRRYSSATNPLLPSSAAATYWRRADASMSLIDLLRQPGTTLPLVPEAQGEAIAFSRDGRGFYSTGERGSGANTPPSPLTYYAPATAPRP